MDALSQLPGVGRRTALRLALFLLRREVSDNDRLCSAISELCHNVHYCRVCHNICDTDVCPICANSHRDRTLVCVVESVQDVVAIENTGQYNGLYHVLGGLISPMDGIGPGDIELASLVARVAQGGIHEVILAVSTTLEGDTTNIYINNRLRRYGVTVSIIARGIAVGGVIEYTDEVTLGRSIVNRTLFDK